MSSTDLEQKARKASDGITDCLHVIANEPSAAFYRIQEHVRKTVPQLMERKHEVQNLQHQLQDSCFGLEYSINALNEMAASQSHFQNIQDLIKNSMFIKQQIQYEQQRRHQRPKMYDAVGRTQTVDVAMTTDNPATHHDFTQSTQLPSTASLSYLHDAPRARSSSLTGRETVTHVPPGGMFK